jgi:Nif-specific regulatory protein
VREPETCIECSATLVQGDTVRELAFRCQQNHGLTQTLHSLQKGRCGGPWGRALAKASAA